METYGCSGRKLRRIETSQLKVVVFEIKIVNNSITLSLSRFIDGLGPLLLGFSGGFWEKLLPTSFSEKPGP
jgi:hypothetical protein